jgi:hypothetical protein
MSDLSIALRQASRESLITFIERALLLMIPQYMHFGYVELIAAMIEELVLRPRLGKLAINLPPRHGKSFILVAVAAWYLGRYPEREVIMVAHSQSLANDLAGKVALLITSELFKSVFPAFKRQEGRETMADFRTDKGGGFRSGGFDTGITGRGCNLLLLDDALSAHDADSVAERTKVCESYDTMIVTRFNNPGAAVAISMSHRLHQDDLTEHLRKLGFDHLILPFEAIENEEFRVGNTVFSRRVGDVLQPGRMSVADIKAIGLAPRVYATQYQQQPTAVGSGLLLERHFPSIATCPPGGQTVVSWDPASSSPEGRSHSVALVFQEHKDVAYLKHITRERLDYGRLKELAGRLHEIFKPTIHLVEATSVGPALAADLRARGANVVDIKVASASKESRLEAVINKLEANYIRPVDNTPRLQEFLNECYAFRKRCFQATALRCSALG